MNYISNFNYIKEMRETDLYVLFWGSEFSQWYKSEFIEDGITFSSAEQYMMYHKAKLFNDNEIATQILSISNVKKIKDLGRKVKGFDEEKWMEYRNVIIYTGNFLKFSQNKELKELLLSFGDKKFVEASPVDKIYGIGLHYDNVLADNEKNWKGLNLLGKQITFVRDDFKKEFDYIKKENK